MKSSLVKFKLNLQYPGKNIVINKSNSEIICEVEPSSEHKDYSLAIAVIDKSQLHYHKVSTEIYTVLKGNLTVTKDGKDFPLSVGETLVIKPLEKHCAKGNETWVEVKSTPGWTPLDHYLI